MLCHLLCGDDNLFLILDVSVCWFKPTCLCMLCHSYISVVVLIAVTCVGGSTTSRNAIAFLCHLYFTSKRKVIHLILPECPMIVIY